MKKTILVPTDFSENAWIATQYAANLALDKKKKLILLYTFLPFYSSFSSLEHNEMMSEEAEKVANAEMDLIREKLEAEFPLLEYECLCKNGILSEVINRENKDRSFQLIVMGTKGASGLRYTIMGSNTFDVINKTEIPVFAIPHQSAYRLNRVGVLSNYKNTELEVLAKFMEIVEDGFTAVLLHVHEEADGFEQAYGEAWKDRVKEESGLQDVSIKVGKGNKVQEVVNEMMVEEEVDLLLVTNNSKSFIKALFSRDIVKSMALKPQIPVLFIKA